MSVSSIDSQSNLLSGVEGTGQDAPTERSLDEGAGSAYDLETDEYMEIMMEQLKHQDPQDPMKTEKMMEQTSALVQLQNNQKMTNKIDEMSTSADKLINSIDEMANSSVSSQYISKIGDNVKIETAEGKTHSGQLEKVNVTGNPEVVIDGENFSTDNINSIGVI